MINSPSPQFAYHNPSNPSYPAEPGLVNKGPAKLNFPPSSTDDRAGLKEELTVNMLEHFHNVGDHQKASVLHNHLLYVLLKYIAKTDYIIHGSTALSLNLPYHSFASPETFCGMCRDRNSNLIAAADCTLEEASSLFPPEPNQWHDIDLFINHHNPNTEEIRTLLRASMGQECTNKFITFTENHATHINKVPDNNFGSPCHTTPTGLLIKSISIQYGEKEILNIDITYLSENKTDNPSASCQFDENSCILSCMDFDCDKTSVNLKICSLESSLDRYINAFIATSPGYPPEKNKYWKKLTAIDSLIQSQMPFIQPAIMMKCVNQIRRSLSTRDTYNKTSIHERQPRITSTQTTVIAVSNTASQSSPLWSGKKVDKSQQTLQWVMEAEKTDRKEFFEIKEKLVESNSQLAMTEKSLAERDQQLAITKKNLAERDQQLAITKKNLAERDQQLAITKKNLAERDQQLAITKKNLAERGQQLALTKKNMAERDQQLTIINKKLTERDQQLKIMNKNLAEKKKLQAQQNKKIITLNTRLQTFDNKTHMEAGVQTSPPLNRSEDRASAIEQGGSTLSGHTSSSCQSIAPDSSDKPPVLTEQKIDNETTKDLQELFNQNMIKLIEYLNDSKRQPLSFYVAKIKELNETFDRLTVPKKNWSHSISTTDLKKTTETMDTLAQAFSKKTKSNGSRFSQIMMYADPTLNSLNYKFKKLYYAMVCFDKMTNLQHGYIKRLGDSILLTKDKLDKYNTKQLKSLDLNFLEQTIEKNYVCIVDIIQTDSGLLTLAESPHPEIIKHMIYILHKITKNKYPEMLLMQFIIYKLGEPYLKKGIIDNLSFDTKSISQELAALNGSTVVCEQLIAIYPWFYEKNDFILSATLLTRHLELISNNNDYYLEALSHGFSSQENKDRIIELYHTLTCDPAFKPEDERTMQLLRIRTQCQLKLKEAINNCHDFLYNDKDLSLPQFYIEDPGLETRLRYWQAYEIQEKSAEWCTIV